MRQYMCTCLQCKGNNNIQFVESIPQYGSVFLHYCKYCKEQTEHTLNATKKMLSKLRKTTEEEERQKSIRRYCQRYGFSCRFLYESVIITTQVSKWQFQYNKDLKTLRHESTVKINFDNGHYAKTHEQFRDRKMSCKEVIDYIAAHDKWRCEQQ